MTDTPEEKLRESCCTVAFSGADHFPKGPTWYVEWLPKGYGPTADDRLVCAFPDPGDWSEKYGLREGERPPLIEAVCAAIERYLRDSESPPMNLGHSISTGSR